MDGELANGQSAEVKDHLDRCPQCKANALSLALLKSSAARVGHRYEMSPETQQRLQRAIRTQPSATRKKQISGLYPKFLAVAGIAALLLLFATGYILRQRHADKMASAKRAAMVAEICDLHIAMLASNQPPEVVSSDRHTVKPWFQGKLPFSFNLPEQLPANTQLIGANLVYLQDRPVAQLLYNVGKHHVSIFIEQRARDESVAPLSAERDGFHVMSFVTADLEGKAVSDVEPAALAALVRAVETAQGTVRQ